MASTPAGIAGVFDRAADTYDAVGVPWFRPIAQGLVDELAVQPGERVLDVGCGRGAALLPLARAAGPDGAVLGIDLSPRMVERTAHDVRDMPQVKVRIADASALDLPPASYDVVASSLVLFFMPDPPAALAGWSQLLVAGGRLGVTTFAAQDERWQQLEAEFGPYLSPEMLDARTSGRRGPFASDSGVEQLLIHAGLVDVRTAHRTIEVTFDNADRWLEFSWSHGQRAMWEAVPEAERDAVRARITAAVVRLQDGSAPLGLTQRVRYTVGRRATGQG